MIYTVNYSDESYSIKNYKKFNLAEIEGTSKVEGEGVRQEKENPHNITF